MKSSARLTIIAALLGGFGISSALAATATGNANATVLTPITISATTPLNFGTLSANATGGTVAITAAGARTVSGTVVVTPAAFSAAVFTVLGTGSATFGITYPTGVSVAGPGTAMGVVLTGASFGTLSGGSLAFPVGGTLTVGANQAAGAYTGSYIMTVEYN